MSRNKINWTAGVLFFCVAITANADFKPKLPSNPLSPEQTSCMQKALGKNLKPTAKQFADAAKSCASAPAAAPAAKPNASGK